MNIHVVCVVIFCVSCVLAEAPAKKTLAKNVKNDLKPKREAPISGGSAYHGPSYKYLPPSSSGSSGSYESYSSGHHGSYSELGANDFGGSSGVGGHGVGHFGATAPKVETYIVQTQSAHAGQGIGHGGGGYRYSGPSSSHSAGYSGHASGGVSSYSHGHGAVHKVKAIVIPTSGFSSGSHGGVGYNRFGGSSGGFGGYSKGSSQGSHFFSGGRSNNIGNGYSTKYSGFRGGYGGSYSSGIGGSSGHVSSSHTQGNSIPLHLLEGSYHDSDYSGGQGGYTGSQGGHSGGQGGYSYEAPVSSYSHGGHGVPSSSYGVPISALSPRYQIGGSAGSAVAQIPSYATGHKGLGHFGYASSKPQPLHTDYVDSNRYEDSYSHHSSHDSSHDSSHYASKAPFKPSIFLGTSHENNIGSGGHISSEYGAPVQSQGISSHYSQPPTSDGYDYPPPSVLYGSPIQSHSGVETTGPAQEPESSYLPPEQPQTSYGPPATPGESYLPPHH